MGHAGSAWRMRRNDGIDRIAQPLAEDLVEVTIQKGRVSDAVARAMRRAVREGYGEREPDQLALCEHSEKKGR
jgi:hypothetical protein